MMMMAFGKIGPKFESNNSEQITIDYGNNNNTDQIDETK